MQASTGSPDASEQQWVALLKSLQSCQYLVGKVDCTWTKELCGLELDIACLKQELSHLPKAEVDASSEGNSDKKVVSLAAHLPAPAQGIQPTQQLPRAASTTEANETLAHLPSELGSITFKPGSGQEVLSGHVSQTAEVVTPTEVAQPEQLTQPGELAAQVQEGLLEPGLSPEQSSEPISAAEKPGGDAGRLLEQLTQPAEAAPPAEAALSKRRSQSKPAAGAEPDKAVDILPERRLLWRLAGSLNAQRHSSLIVQVCGMD